MSKYKVALIGCGRIGALLEENDLLRHKPCTHIGAYKALPNAVKVTAVCDVDIDKTKKVAMKWRVPFFYKDYQNMLKDHNFDIVSVCTPDETHFEILKTVVRFEPKLVFMEKPLATRVSDAERMIQTCKENNIILAVNHTRRWHPLYQQIQKQVQNGRIGKLIHAIGIFSGKWLRDGIHMFDLFNSFQAPTYTAINPNTKYLLFELDLIGTTGRIRITDNGRLVTRQDSRPSTHYGLVNELSYPYMESAWEKTNPLVNAVVDLVKCVKTGKKPECTGEDGLLALRRCLNYPRR